jgi:hypothetical protein
MSFRNGFIAGLLLAIILGVWLSQLWQPARQVSLHTEHLLRDVAEKRWARIEKFVAADYQDDWGHDRASALARLRQVLSYTRNARIEPSVPIVRVGEGEGSWRARITFEADPNEVTDLIRSRVNALEEPFDLRWRRQSWKPWDWQLVRVSNPALELRGY